MTEIPPLRATLTVDEAAELLRIKPGTLRHHLRRGTYPGLKVGGAWRMLRAEVAALLAKAARR